MPYFVLIFFRNLPGLAGFYVAAVYSGTLSTVSSGINSSAALILDDFVLSIKPSMSNKAKLRFSKWSVFFLGMFVTSIAYLASVLGGSVIKMILTFRGACAGPAFGVFFLAIFVPWATTKGALTGQLAGTCLSMTLACGMYFYGKGPKFQQRISHSTDQCITENIVANTSVPPIFQAFFATTEMSVSEKVYPSFYSLSFMLVGVVGIMTTITVGVIVSFITGASSPEKAESKYFQPLVDNPCFPKSVRSFFRFGVPESKVDQDFDLDRAEFAALGKNPPEEEKENI